METNIQTCPCEAVKKLEKIVEKHDDDLHKGDTTFAVINTKLNIVLGVLAVVGTAICGVVIKMIF